MKDTSAFYTPCNRNVCGHHFSECKSRHCIQKPGHGNRAFAATSHKFKPV